MSFVMPSKYGSNLPLPKDPSVTIKEVPQKIVAVVAFSGLSISLHPLLYDDCLHLTSFLDYLRLKSEYQIPLFEMPIVLNLWYVHYTVQILSLLLHEAVIF